MSGESEARRQKFAVVLESLAAEAEPAEGGEASLSGALPRMSTTYLARPATSEEVRRI